MADTEPDTDKYFCSSKLRIISKFCFQEDDVGVDALPVCCGTRQLDTSEERIRLAAKNYLKVIMKLAGEVIIPYDLHEISGLYELILHTKSYITTFHYNVETHNLTSVGCVSIYGHLSICLSIIIIKTETKLNQNSSTSSEVRVTVIVIMLPIGEKLINFVSYLSF